ncbi:membrane protein [Microbacterium phage Cece]|nr:membrane protein [Microbacterium phage Cece]
MDTKPKPFIHRKKTKRHNEVGVLMIGHFALPLVIPYTLLIFGAFFAAIFGAFQGHGMLVLTFALLALVVSIVVSVITSIVKTIIRANKDEREAERVYRPEPGYMSNGRSWRGR